jgi:hypothetical protein
MITCKNGSIWTALGCGCLDRDRPLHHSISAAWGISRSATSSTHKFHAHSGRQYQTRGHGQQAASRSPSSSSVDREKPGEQSIADCERNRLLDLNRENTLHKRTGRFPDPCHCGTAKTAGSIRQAGTLVKQGSQVLAEQCPVCLQVLKQPPNSTFFNICFIA